MDAASVWGYNKNNKNARGLSFETDQAFAEAAACRGLPAALAADGEPPLYEVYSYASPEEFMELFLGGDEGLTYDMVSSKYALYIQALEADESLACHIAEFAFKLAYGR